MERKSSALETLTGLCILIAVGAQTWMVVQDSTQGDAGRWVRRYWNSRLRPKLVWVVLWIDSKAVIDRMIDDEVMPLLKGNQ